MIKRLRSWGEKRLLPWGERSARVWAAHWLLIVGGLLIVGSAFLKWVEYPFSANLSGLKLPFFGHPGVIPHIVLFSFGALGILAFVGGLFLLRYFVSALTLAASILITLCVLAPEHIAFQQPVMLRRLTDELQAAPMTRVFAREFLPENFGAPEEVPHALVLYDARGRLLAAFSFLRLGWTCFAIGSLLVAIYAIRRLPDGKILAGVALVCLPLGAFAAVLTPPLIGQYYFNRGSIAKASGHDQEAIADYRKAMKWDAWNAEDINLYATIGDLQIQSGIEHGSPERHISRAVKFQAAKNYESAIFELGQAAEAGGAIQTAARRESAKTRVAFGLALYSAGGIGSAVTNWQLALADDPTQVYALPYLVRGYFDIGRYDVALQIDNRLFKIVAGHDSRLADAYSLAGDCYAKLRRDDDARRYYNLSLTVDPIENYWALGGLAGE